ncbi:hypothetical protein [Polaromonas sp. C04]|uniref:hypothetical protein n=1 Tax=Polaromonas sp. C04 TaxID=1945857 RepID=UPI000984E3B1|nr:hypothetical protein [Polaromonas sp. C04]OOG53197.1 hypothetical protein B0E49_12095 [Polaromonas sp. C04]
MSNYSFPNPADDSKSQLTYSVAAEFIYRLDLFLEHQDKNSNDGCVPVEVVRTVGHCAEAALEMLFWAAGDSKSAHEGSTPRCSVADDADACEMIAGVAEVLDRLFQSQTVSRTAVAPNQAKWQLMTTVAGEFFLRLGALAENVANQAQNTVDYCDVEMLRGCVDAAMGMVYELSSATWLAGHAMPARAILAMYDHVRSHRLECAGPQAVQLIQDVYEAVTSQVISQG